MDLKEAMRQRHTVRRYTDRPLSAEITGQLQQCIDKINETHGLSIALKTEDINALPRGHQTVSGKGSAELFSYISIH